jgi:uncharacterized repeat protein (TIGR02543 family)
MTTHTLHGIRGLRRALALLVAVLALTGFAAALPQPASAGAFAPDVYVHGAGQGIGSVVGPNIDCDIWAGVEFGDCHQEYAFGDSVTLIAHASAGSQFTGWSSGCTTVWFNACQLSLGFDDKSVTATFELVKKLTVTKNGTGTGTVASAPGGIGCGGDCDHEYLKGSVVTLTPSPAPGSVFSSWGGACAGVAANLPCAVTMSANKNVTATFTAVPSYELAVVKAGPGSGSVASAPAGIDCGATCAAGYLSGTGVTLTATPDPGATFAGWSGACAGTNPTCNVTMDAAKAVTATFGTLEVPNPPIPETPQPPTPDTTQADQSVDAEILHGRVVKAQLGRRIAKVELGADEQVSALVQVLKNGRVIKGKQVSFGPGERVVSLKLKRGVRGLIVVKVTFDDHAGNESTDSIKLRVRR